MKKAVFFLISIASITIQSFAEKQGQQKIDSLLAVLKIAKADTARVNTLNLLASEFINNNPDSAVSFANKAQALATKLNYKMGIAYACLNHGKAITNQSIAYSHTYIRKVYTKQKKNKEAIQYLNKGLSLAKEIGNLEVIKVSYDGLAALDSAQGNFKQSLEHYKMFIIMRDSMYNKENTKKLAQSQIQYEFDKKRLADSLANQKEKLLRDLSYQETLYTKSSQRNIFFFTGLAFLLLSGGLWSRLRYIRRSTAIIQKEKERSEILLLNILPAEIARELKEKGKADAKYFEEVSVLFTDFEDFTGTSEKLSVQDLLSEINACFEAFDDIIGKYGIEKIKTIGDSYMAAGGLPVHCPESVKNTVKAGLEMQEFIIRRLHEREAQDYPAFEMRIGIHTGPIVAGIVGVKKFQYDIWGDTVNTAACMENRGEIRKVNISKSTFEFIRDDPGFCFEYRGKLEAKHKGELDMYFVFIR